MKKLISLVIILSMMLSVYAQSISAEASTECHSSGDVNCDDKVNLRDVSLMLQYIAKWSNLSVDLNRADVTNDSKVNLLDVSVVLQYLAKWDNVTLGHNYSKHMCTKCGTVDTDHAYEYLMEWVKKNGEAYGSVISFTYYDESGDDLVMYSLEYSAEYDNLYIETSSYSQDEYFYSSIQLDSYFCGVYFLDCKVYGYIDAANFTSNYPITFKEYVGDESIKWDMVELTRLSANDLICWLDWCLEAYSVGITIQDLGFYSYVCS